MRKSLVSLVSLVCLVSLVSLTSCKKETTLGNGTQFRATMEGCTSAKTTLNGTALEWVSGDQIAIYGTAGAGIYTATPQSDATTAIFDNVSGETGDGPFRAFYPATLTTDGVNITLPAVQDYVEGSINEFPMYAESSDNELSFKNLCGVIKLNLKKTGVSISSIAITAASEINGTWSVGYVATNHDDFTKSGDGFPMLQYVSGGTTTTTLICATPQSIAGTEGKDFYIYLPQNLTGYSGLQITMAASDGTICTKTANTPIVVERSKVTAITFGESNLDFVEPLPEGALSGLFTYNSDGDQLRFSQGNLQYQASTGTWRFAENQYDCLGSANSSISATNSGWIDLFGWNTVNNPTLTSTENSDYANITSDNMHLSHFVDWGVNAISNGGGIVNSGWRTLSQLEWGHVLFGRANNTNLSTANARYAKGKVNNVQGLILFPDGYIHPTGVTPPTGINEEGSTGWNNNNYTLAQWADMEAAGAVFLPAAGYRGGLEVNRVGEYGYYWSTTLCNTTQAYEVFFRENQCSTGFGDGFCYGLSVRLARNSN